MFSYRRWRHTRGYGVHSPFAYMLTREVVRPERGYSYYGYEAIEAAVRSARLPFSAEREARLLLRLIVRLRPESVFLPREFGAAFRAAVKAADTRISVEDRQAYASSCRMIVSRGDTIQLDLLIRHLAVAGNSLLIRDIPQGWAERLFAEMKEGLMLYSPHNALLVAREDMQKVSYSMKI